MHSHGLSTPKATLAPTPELSDLVFIGDLNARHPILGNNDNNAVGRTIFNLIGDGKFNHMGPDFRTFVTNRIASTPEIILNNMNQCHNFHAKPGRVTTSDHLPVIINLSGSPIQIPTEPRLDLKHTNWDNFKNDLQQYEYEPLDGKD